MEATRAAMEREAKAKARPGEASSLMAREVDTTVKLGLVGASSSSSEEKEEEKEEEEEEEEEKRKTLSRLLRRRTSKCIAKRRKLPGNRRRGSIQSLNPLDLFAALEGTKKTPFEKQTTASGEVIENAVVTKKDKLSSVFATMLGSMMGSVEGAG